MAGTMSILGLWHIDNDILDTMVLPDSLEDFRENINTNILLDCAELEILYPDHTFLKSAIEAWSRKQAPVWDELYKTTQYEYTPIWNKDGTYTETETTERNLSGTENKQGNGTNKTTGNTEYTDQSTGEENEFVYGYNSQNDARKGKTTNQDSANGTGKSTTNTTSTAEEAATRGEDEHITFTRTREEHGNIGVTSTQSLILEQRNVVQFNIVDVIVNEFKARFCLLVY